MRSDEDANAASMASLTASAAADAGASVFAHAAPGWTSSSAKSATRFATAEASAASARGPARGDDNAAAARAARNSARAAAQRARPTRAVRHGGSLPHPRVARARPRRRRERRWTVRDSSSSSSRPPAGTTTRRDACQSAAASAARPWCGGFHAGFVARSSLYATPTRRAGATSPRRRREAGRTPPRPRRAPRRRPARHPPCRSPRPSPRTRVEGCARANAAHRRRRVRVAKSFAKRHKLERFGVRAVFVRPRDVRPDILRGVRAKAIGEIAQMRRERCLRATLRRG